MDRVMRRKRETRPPSKGDNESSTEGSSASPAAAAAPMLPRMSNQVVRVIPLGGLGEVGKNMTVFEYGGETVVIDAGLAFPRDEHLGVDLILPDFGYLRDREVR